jgi:hypothetical protein
MSTPTSETDISDKVTRVMTVIDREGRPPLPIVAWIDMLEDIKSECESRIIAAREDMQRAK